MAANRIVITDPELFAQLRALKGKSTWNDFVRTLVDQHAAAAVLREACPPGDSELPYAAELERFTRAMLDSWPPARIKATSLEDEGLARLANAVLDSDHVRSELLALMRRLPVFSREGEPYMKRLANEVLGGKTLAPQIAAA